MGAGGGGAPHTLHTRGLTNTATVTKLTEYNVNKALHSWKLKSARTSPHTSPSRSCLQGQLQTVTSLNTYQIKIHINMTSRNVGFVYYMYNLMWESSHGDDVEM